jgi:hypothetical protein
MVEGDEMNDLIFGDIRENISKKWNKQKIQDMADRHPKFS